MPTTSTHATTFGDSRNISRSIEAGPGWVIDEATLRPRITDLKEFRRTNQDDPLLPALEALFLGRACEAESLLDVALESDPSNMRIRSLRADAWRDQGRTDAAIVEYQRLLERTREWGTEATIRQHLGKALVAAGQYQHAMTQFSIALEMRMLSGADAAAVASTLQALSRTRELLEEQSEAASTSQPASSARAAS